MRLKLAPHSRGGGGGGSRRPSPGRSAASRGEGLWGKGDMAAPLPLGSTVEAKLESEKERERSLASSVILPSLALFCLLCLSPHPLTPSTLSPTPPRSCSPSTGLQCRNIIQMMANHRSLESRERQPEITRPDNQCVCVLITLAGLG